MAKNHYDALGIVPRESYHDLGATCFEAAMQQAEAQAKGRTPEDRQFSARQKLAEITERNKTDARYQEAFNQLLDPAEATNYYHAKQEETRTRDRNRMQTAGGVLATAAGAGVLAATLALQGGSSREPEQEPARPEPKNVKIITPEPQRKIFQDTTPYDKMKLPPEAPQQAQAPDSVKPPHGRITGIEQPEKSLPEKTYPEKAPHGRIIGIEPSENPQKDVSKPHGRILGIEPQAKPHARIIGIEPQSPASEKPKQSGWKRSLKPMEDAPEETKPQPNGRTILR